MLPKTSANKEGAKTITKGAMIKTLAEQFVKGVEKPFGYPPEDAPVDDNRVKGGRDGWRNLVRRRERNLRGTPRP